MFKTRELRQEDLKKNITASIHTDVGCVRETNEDSVSHIIPRDDEMLKRRGTLTVVADGMGGHASGEIASKMAVELISSYYYGDRDHSPDDALVIAIEQANSDIYEASVSDEKYYGMGTTVIAFVILEDRAYSAHVGDSRLYHMNGRDLELLTIDHSEVMELVKQGILSMEEAANHEDKNVILQALGTKPEVNVEVSVPLPVNLYDEFLLCSDGLSDMVSDEEIARIWFEADDIYYACKDLINQAKINGGHDNVSVGIIRIEPEEKQKSGGAIRQTREIKAIAQ
ncbi:MAG: Stp1/IreP family PP2C-type Ser/Thr phosphatase [Pyrinomonadaceae bacterium]